VLYVNNQIFVSIKVNNIIIPLAGGQLRNLTITESSNQFLPTIEIELLDQLGLLFSEPAIYDGVVISVSLSTDQKNIDSNWKNYLVYPRRVFSTRAGYIINIVGLLDHPNYVLGTTYNSYNSSSYSSFLNIALGIIIIKYGMINRNIKNIFQA
jgi:hypothetical protein